MGPPHTCQWWRGVHPYRPITLRGPSPQPKVIAVASVRNPHGTYGVELNHAEDTHDGGLSGLHTGGAEDGSELCSSVLEGSQRVGREAHEVDAQVVD